MADLRLWACGLGVAAAGCASGPPLENPTLIRPAAAAAAGDENPILVTPGQPNGASYAEIYEAVVDVLDDYYDLKPTSRYAGHIETVPAVSPGYERPWKGGNPDARQRLIATFQSMRNFAVVDIWAGERGGYRVYLEVYKELEDVPVPIGNTRQIVKAVFQDRSSVDRTLEVIGAQASPDSGWIPKGRDYCFEQMLLRKIRERVSLGCK